MDRIAETYHGQGDAWDVERSRARLTWMVQWARGRRALDWGCSQGIATHLLAEKGLEAVGFDVDVEAIEYARRHYPKPRFITDRAEIGGGFDTILLGEVLEHQESPAALLDEVLPRLGGERRVVVTVPHGWNDCLDHRQIFTLTTFLDLFEPRLSVVDLSFVDGFIRFVGTPEPTGWRLTRDLHREAERDLLANHRRERARAELIQAAFDACQRTLEKRQREMEELRESRSFQLVDGMKRVRRALGTR